MTDKKRIAVLASGSGSNFQVITEACQRGDIAGEMVVLVTNQRYAGAFERARALGVETLVFEPADFKTRTLYCSKMAKALREKEIDLVVLAGFLLKIEPCLIRAFPNRILNIHPALLPKYGGKGMYGRHVHAAVLAAGDATSGCTVHLVNEIYDQGPIIAQRTVAVDPTDTPESLAEKIHVLEHQLYPAVIRDVCSGKINLDQVAAAAAVKGSAL